MTSARRITARVMALLTFLGCSWALGGCGSITEGCETADCGSAPGPVGTALRESYNPDSEAHDNSAYRVLASAMASNVTPQASSAPNWTGEWNAFGDGGQPFAMTLIQNGDYVSGTFAGHGPSFINGTSTDNPRSGLTFIGTYSQPQDFMCGQNPDSGSVTFSMNPDRNSFNGTWSRGPCPGHQTSGVWNGIRKNPVRAVTIDVFRPDGSSFDPSAGENVTLEANGTTSGYSNPGAVAGNFAIRGTRQASGDSGSDLSVQVDPVPPKPPFPTIGFPFPIASGTLTVRSDGSWVMNNVTWDGKIDSRAVDPAEYQLELSVTVNGAEGPATAQLSAPLAIGSASDVQITKIRFGSSVSVSAGPFPVFDYLGKRLRGDIGSIATAQWERTSAGIDKTPLVYSKGSTISVGPRAIDVSKLPASTEDLVLSLSGRLGPQDIPFKVASNGNSEMVIPRDSWSSGNLAGDWLFASTTTLPNAVRRYNLELFWIIEGRTATGTSLGITEQKTQHRLYATVNRPIPFSADPQEAGNPWYNSETFDLSSAEALGSGGRGISGRSPLDMATIFADGATSETEFLEKLTNSFFDETTYVYTGDSGFTDHIGVDKALLVSLLQTDEYHLRGALKARGLQCRDIANFVRVLAGMGGVFCSTLRISPTTSGNFVANYPSPKGRGKGLDAAYYAPLSVLLAPNATETTRNTIRKLRLISSSNTLDEPFYSDNFATHLFMQIPWTFHQVIIHNGIVYDASTRADANRGAPVASNLDFYVNQLNIANLSKFKLFHVQLLGFLPKIGVELNSAVDYAARVNAQPVPMFVSQASYLEWLVYLADRTDSIRRTTGYDPKVTTPRVPFFKIID